MFSERSPLKSWNYRGAMPAGARIAKKEGRPFPGAPPFARVSRYFWMQVSTVSLVHSSSPVNTGSSTCLPSIRSIMTVGAL